MPEAGARQPHRLGMRLGVCNAGQHNRQARKKRRAPDGDRTRISRVESMVL